MLFNIFVQLYIIYMSIGLYIFINEVFAFYNIIKKDKEFADMFKGKFIKIMFMIVLANDCCIWPFKFDIIPKSVSK